MTFLFMAFCVVLSLLMILQFQNSMAKLNRLHSHLKGQLCLKKMTSNEIRLINTLHTRNRGILALKPLKESAIPAIAQAASAAIEALKAEQEYNFQKSRIQIIRDKFCTTPEKYQYLKTPILTNGLTLTRDSLETTQMRTLQWNRHHKIHQQIWKSKTQVSTNLHVSQNSLMKIKVLD